jgi:hypothetical protein
MNTAMNTGLLTPHAPPAEQPLAAATARPLPHPLNPAATYRVGLLLADQAQAVFELRRAAYRQAAEFQWHDEHRLRWCADDDTGTVLGLWNAQGRLLSTLRASVLVSRQAVAQFLEYSLQGQVLPVSPLRPCLVFSRAATWPSHARHGLFVLMRLAYLQAVQHTAVDSLCAVVYEGGPRLRAMRAAGYSLRVPQGAWDSEARALSQPLLAVLRRPQFHRACQHVQQALAARPGGAPPLQVDLPAMVASLQRSAAQAALSAR